MILINPYLVIPSSVAIPDLTDIIHLYSTFGITTNFQDNGPLIKDGNENTFTGISPIPYSLDWSVITSPLLWTWYDQNNSSIMNGEGHFPDIDTSNQLFTFNGTDQYLAQESSEITNTNKLTIYCVFKTRSLVSAQTLFQHDYTRNFITAAGNLFSGYITNAGVLTIIQKTDDVVDLFNSKIKSIDTNFHLLTTIFDRSLSGAGATIAKIDNSTSGWSSVQISNMGGNFSNGSSIGLGLGEPLGADVYFNGHILEFWVFNGAHDDTRQTSVYNFIKYLHPSIG